MLRALLATTALLVLAPAAQAANFQVDTDADVGVTPADCTDASAATPCSIRDALAAAGGTTEDDRVLVPADDYVLNGTALEVTGPGLVTIVGATAATTTIDGNDASRVFNVVSSATIENVTIRDGHDPLEGGGIFVHNGTFTLRDSVVESNEAGTAAGQLGQGGGIGLGHAALRIERSFVRDNRAGFRGGGLWSTDGSDPMTLVDSTVTANRAEPATGGSAVGGGIWADGELNLTRVALTDNTARAIATSDDSASAGGAIALSDATIVDSTITGNHAIGTNLAEARGGGLYLTGTEAVQITGTTLADNTASATNGAAEGGAIRQFSGALTITNSTLSGNSVTASMSATVARGGGAVIDTPVTLTNVTIVGNSASGTNPSGGNLAADEAVLRNTIVAGGVPANCVDPVASAVGSLETGTTCSLGAGNRSAVANPRLGPLAANGGPALTHALLTGSPAIDTGTRTGAPATDQRGVRRPQRDGIDIGAYELVGPATPRPPGSPPDRTAPAFADLDLTRDAFRARRGTTALYSLSEAATVTFRVQRRTKGRRVNGRCVKRTRSNRTRPRCVRHATVRRVTAQATAGDNRLRIRTRRLKAGRYRLVATAMDEAGNRSAPARIAFRIRPRA